LLLLLVLLLLLLLLSSVCLSVCLFQMTRFEDLTCEKGPHLKDFDSLKCDRGRK
jgi:hypothetical protein